MVRSIRPRFLGILLLALLVVRIGAQDQPDPDAQASSQPLPKDMQNTLWKVLAKVQYNPMDEEFIPIFPPELKKLDGKIVNLKGFMIPLEPAEEQTRFVLTPFPLGGCFFCSAGGGPESLVDVRSQKAIKFSYDPIRITGRLELLQKDETQLFFRIKDAIQPPSKQDMR